MSARLVFGLLSIALSIITVILYQKEFYSQKNVVDANRNAISNSLNADNWQKLRLYVLCCGIFVITFLILAVPILVSGVDVSSIRNVSFNGMSFVIVILFVIAISIFARKALSLSAVEKGIVKYVVQLKQNSDTEQEVQDIEIDPLVANKIRTIFVEKDNVLLDDEKIALATVILNSAGVPKISRMLVLLAGAAPIFGLVGTIVGLVQAFTESNGIGYPGTEEYMKGISLSVSMIFVAVFVTVGAVFTNIAFEKIKDTLMKNIYAAVEKKISSKVKVAIGIGI